MGIFDRFRATAPSSTNGGKPDTSGQDATRLIDEGHVLEAEGKLDEAMQCYLDAIRLAPNLARAHLNHGNVLLLKGDLKGALDAFSAAIIYQPDYAGAYYNIGNALLNDGKLDEAVASFRRALEIQPEYAEVHCSLGVALKELGQMEDAIACFRRALEINPDLVEAHLNLGSSFLSQGRYAEGWPEYETRYDPRYSGRQSFPPDLPFPQWQGQPLDGKSIMVWPEQGFGDEIQFARYFPMLKAMNVSYLTLVSKTPLKALMEQVEGVDKVILVSEAASLPPHDYWTFPLSFPRHFATTVETIPSHLPYLSVPLERLNRWRTHIPKNGPTVGLVWKGNMAPNPHRSLPDLLTLAKLWSVPGINFISLQKGLGEEEAATPPTGQPILNLGSDIQDFADTAAIVTQLDLVICIDTAIAHLVGALNIPCWVLLPAIGADWRWLQERMDSPWYPGVMRLFRQTKSGDWSATIDDVAQSLKSWVDERKQF
ncbi:MAG TPA: tetratricopeptide repeat-containing glycosyltransferase family protein [Gallionella sp.]